MGIFDSFDNDDPKPRPAPSHWLDEWNVQLPVNSQGKPSGRATSQNASSSYKPWYVIRGREFWCKKPHEGAETGNTSSTRCELSQQRRWNHGKIKFDVQILEMSERDEAVTFFQCREGSFSHELIQLRAYVHRNELNIRLNENSKDSRWTVPCDFSKKVRVEAEVNRNKYIRVWVNGEKFEADTSNRNHKPNDQHWKLGVYGPGDSEAKFTGLEWS